MQQIIAPEPRSLKTACQVIKHKLHKTVSRDTLKRLLKQAGDTWQRVRRSLRTLRKEEDFRAAPHELAKLRTVCANRTDDFALRYFDETGLTLTPCLPYAWQAPGQPLELPSLASPRLHVPGLLTLRGAFHSYVTESSGNSAFVLRCFDADCAQLTKPCLIVLANASMQRSAAFAANIEAWKKEELPLLFLPPSCPELNLIAILWRKLKYEWLPLSAYESFQQLATALSSTLKLVGSKYLLSFA